MPETIRIFTKPGCPHCARAKSTLDEAGLPYDEIDVRDAERDADLSVWLSGVSTVPQVFVGNMHVGGATDVVALRAARRLTPLAAAAQATLDLDGPSDEDLREGAEDYALRRAIPEVDGARSEDERDWPILRMYKKFFGFWPNCFYYQYHWPEVAYRQFVYCHNTGAVGGGRQVLGAPVMNALGYATSNAHGCDYCQVHSASVGDEDSAGYAKAIDAARDGDHSGTFGPFEAALADLVAHASTNTVTDANLARLEETAGEARFSKLPTAANREAAAMIAAAFGFLNVFNDLTGVKVEAKWARKAEDGAGIGTGRHGASEDRDSTNLDYDLPEGGPSMASMIAHYGKDAMLAGGPAAYAKDRLGFEPAWMDAWPLPPRPLHARFYVGVMTDVDAGDVRIAPELKHLMARVSHVAKGHDALAAEEGRLAFLAVGGGQRAADRVRHAFGAARGRGPGGLFDPAETAALRLAWVSAQTPLVTPRRWVQPAIDLFEPTELVHLITVCALASMVQRFAAIARPRITDGTRTFLHVHDLPLDTLTIRFPLPRDGRAAAA